jgi:hypothetical protein
MIWGQGRVPFWEGDCSLGHPVNVACKGCPSLAMAWLPLLLRPPGARHNGPLTVPALIQSSWSRFLDKGPRGRAFTETSRGSHLGAASAQMWRSREWGRQISRQGMLGRPFREVPQLCFSREALLWPGWTVKCLLSAYVLIQVGLAGDERGSRNKRGRLFTCVLPVLDLERACNT